ncbi:2-iminobutanoate/2-iminopropanoate deaminase [Thermotomaculum hydrothermale]|uniref:2-iminobutanoate/2-iminopropanoate deaminase n=1 Tax=Thermotomaculum hydrothermale TaxID=981385 RepID=A0A7R6PQ65_9BACT|nr:RidA family protein [Thermotomaculum hydrothermale]BBB33291.1 2-iminobutanoate/2-iminopropanoate deaminase [Thermotomaculum hydrothermale]
MEFIQTDRAPKAIGPYSQAVKANGFVFCSGQISINPESGEIVGENVKEQTEQVLKNLFNVLEAAGTSYKNVVKTTVFLADMSTFGEMNEVYEKMFNGHKPARAAVAVKTLPKNVLVEIEAIATE